MEGKDNEFMFFNQSVADLVDAFPFNNSFTFQQENEEFNNIFNFQDVDFFDPFVNNKKGLAQIIFNQWLQKKRTATHAKRM